MARLPNSELENLENVTALALRIQMRIKRLVYQVDDPDLLADMVGIAADAAAIRKIIINEKLQRKKSDDL